MRFESDIENIRDLNPTAIRIPSSLKEELKKQAKQNKTSLNAEIVHRLQRTVEEDENSDMLPLQEQIDYLDNRINESDAKIRELDAKIRELQGHY